MECTTLIDARWLLEFAQDNVVPERKWVVLAWQHVPEEAVASVERLRYCQTREAKRGRGLLPVKGTSRASSRSRCYHMAGLRRRIPAPTASSCARWCRCSRRW